MHGEEALGALKMRAWVLRGLSISKSKLSRLLCSGISISAVCVTSMSCISQMQVKRSRRLLLSHLSGGHLPCPTASPFRSTSLCAESP